MSLSLKQLSDAELMRSLHQTVRHSRRCLVELLQQLHEIEHRRLHVARAYNSMFALCRSLGFSEGEAYKRIAVARVSVLYPMVLELLANGELHLTGAALLAPHLTAANAESLLEEAKGKSKLRIQNIVASLKPSAPCAADLRRLGRVGGDNVVNRDNRVMVQGIQHCVSGANNASRTEATHIDCAAKDIVQPLTRVALSVRHEPDEAGPSSPRSVLQYVSRQRRRQRSMAKWITLKATLVNSHERRSVTHAFSAAAEYRCELSYVALAYCCVTLADDCVDD